MSDNENSNSVLFSQGKRSLMSVNMLPKTLVNLFLSTLKTSDGTRQTVIVTLISQLCAPMNCIMGFQLVRNIVFPNHCQNKWEIIHMHIRHDHCNLDLTAVCIIVLHYGISISRKQCIPYPLSKRGDNTHVCEEVLLFMLLYNSPKFSNTNAEKKC